MAETSQRIQKVLDQMDMIGDTSGLIQKATRVRINHSTEGLDEITLQNLKTLGLIETTTGRYCETPLMDEFMTFVTDAMGALVEKKDAHRELPGEGEAKKLGYTLHHRSGDRTSATYTKPEGISLTVYADNKCRLEALVGIFIISSGELSPFPHPHFAIFEKKMAAILAACDEYQLR